ncbi:hypothetical protein LZV00_01885 [Pseudomonas kielensis]|uniref:hypothetical protein n=1 Tax=Pseudomonas kielensis TaxID=2762577 RepID=UPI002240B283|nr:hypothetical protein [Pseudomonas kielensis]UZM14593.1 hypothetical protein LZV00_01885 [Pseudomonas kielensis]
MSDFDISEMSAELTGSAGVPDVVEDGQALPSTVVDSVEEFDQYRAEKDLRVSNDVEDTAAAEQEREAQRGGKRTVPLGALQQERIKRQELQLELEAHRQQLAALQQQQAQWQQYQQQVEQQAAADAIPAFEDDPQGHIEAVKDQFRQELESLKQGQARQQVAAQFQREVETIAPIVTQAENAFREANPDYDAAFNYVQTTVEQNMRAQHPGATEADMQMLRTATLVRFNKECLSRGINPAEHIYGRAQELGYSPGQRVPASQGYQVTDTPRKEPNTSLSNLSGSARAPDEKGKMTSDRVSAMSDQEFDDFFASMDRASRVRIKF